MPTLTRTSRRNWLSRLRNSPAAATSVTAQSEVDHASRRDEWVRPMITTEAWVIHAGPGAEPVPAELSLERMEFPDLAENEALVEPIFGSWEANMDHGLRRSPVDICR